MQFPLKEVMSQGDAPLSTALAIIYLHVGLHTCNICAKVGFIIAI